MYNKEEQINKTAKYFMPMLNRLFSTKGITFQPMDGALENWVFKSKEGKEARVAHRCFYRESGISHIRQEDGENKFTFVEVTDEMFYNTFMKAWIEMLLN